ncbi:acyltransferase [Pararhizobium sp. BT-229]|uniref:acyltransferase family protein n=1 Tax=Pararhizobium sp. BT-229 TaxID=2986923 RepID=UPI0021F782C5|nr:acyltransferase [Pararhizobium sp. BT-229]MCV9966012.1 acyltransferase [Pararhizobium sp. BT-229]
MVERRLPGADFVRAVACLMVLAHHLVLRLDVSAVSPTLLPALTLARFGNFGVSVFFVLSGFLLARPFWLALDNAAPRPSIRIYALRRAARILPGFWLALTVGFILSVTVFGGQLNGALLERYVAGAMLVSQFHWSTFFPVTVNGPLWSIPFEITSYILLPVAFVLLFQRQWTCPWATRLIWVAVIFCVLGLHWLIVRTIAIDEAGRGWAFGMQGGAKEWMPRFNPIGFFAIFALGSLAAGIHTWIASRRIRLPDSIGVAALLTAFFVFALSARQPFEGYGLLGVPYAFPLFPLSVAAVLTTVPLTPRLGGLLDGRAIRFIATVSFGIYVWQDIVIHLIKKVVPWSFTGPFHDPLMLWLISCAIATALIMAVAMASFYLLERPVMRWARRLEKPAT